MLWPGVIQASSFSNPTSTTTRWNDPSSPGQPTCESFDHEHSSLCIPAPPSLTITRCLLAGRSTSTTCLLLHIFLVTSLLSRSSDISYCIAGYSSDSRSLSSFRAPCRKGLWMVHDDIPALPLKVRMQSSHYIVYLLGQTDILPSVP